MEIKGQQTGMGTDRGGCERAEGGSERKEAVFYTGNLD